MNNDEMRQIHDQLHKAQNRYTYFLLAAAASAIALIIKSTDESTFAIPMLPLGLAVISWGVSFFYGCKNIQFVNSTLYANYNYLIVKSGLHPKAGKDPELISAASQGIRKAMEYNSERANRFVKWQFKLLVIGALFYLVWHLLEMLARTIG